jgi:hypothetical protein
LVLDVASGQSDNSRLLELDHDMLRSATIVMLLIALAPTLLLPGGGLVCLCEMAGAAAAEPSEGAPKSCCAHDAAPAHTCARNLPSGNHLTSTAPCRLCILVPEAPQSAVADGHAARVLECTTVELAPVPLPLDLSARLDLDRRVLQCSPPGDAVPDIVAPPLALRI